MIKAYPFRVIVQDIDLRQWGLYPHGDETLAWLEDTSGNPVLRHPDNDRLYYADWDNETHSFQLKELFSMASRKAFLKKTYSAPSVSERQLIRQKKLQSRYQPLIIDDEQFITAATSLAAPRESRPVLYRSVSNAETIEEGVIEPSTVVKSSGTPPAQNSIKRNILLIYVTFTNSTGTVVPDDYIINSIIGNQTTPRTLFHYYHEAFKGAVQLSIINNKVYRVKLPKQGFRYDTNAGGQKANTSKDIEEDVFVPALKKVLADNNLNIFDWLNGDIDDTHSYASYTDASGNKVSLGGAEKAIDPASVLPIFLIHGQEAASSTGTGTAKEVNVWGKANPGTGSIFFKEGDGKTPYYSHTMSKIYTWDPTTGKYLYNFKYRLTAWATFGMFRGTDYFTLGVVCHELGHALFYLLDLYDVYTPSRGAAKSEDDIPGIGSWSLMGNNWTYVDADPTPGNSPPLLDGFSMWCVNHKFTTPITKSGTYTITDPQSPHVILMKDKPDEMFVLQLRNYESYDRAIIDTYKHTVFSSGLLFNDNSKPGILLEHVNVARYLAGDEQYGLTSKGYSGMLCAVMEAHGGLQNLLQDTISNDWGYGDDEGYNDGDDHDLYAAYGKDKFGASTDPSNSLWLQSGNGGFEITDMVVNPDGTASYTITFLGDTADDPDYDSLPDDPFRPDEPTTPDPDPEPDPDPDPEPDPDPDPDPDPEPDPDPDPDPEPDPDPDPEPDPDPDPEPDPDPDPEPPLTLAAVYDWGIFTNFYEVYPVLSGGV